MDPAELRRRVEAASVARLATVDADGRPNVVPFCFVLVGETLYSVVDDKPKTTTALQRLANIERDPRAAVLVDHYDDDWSKLWWVRLRGTGRVLTGGAEWHEAVDLLAGKYEAYRHRRPSGPVLAIDVTDWKSWVAGASGDENVQG
jgi:PPOX class probable F420-dependent enzyme